VKLTRLRLVGFKSFVDSTDFLIEPGLTGVVGPNGCGKSNLVEALRWVMGESSHKSLRASGMDDVIFAGSGQRPSRNTAEVMLAIDNRDRRAPASFNEHDQLEVSRRIEREAGSTYRVNGREVRARDVQLLFADAATGARSHAMVRQGQIGEIISAKPQARRRILEDAAGIAGLHGRRHEAELRLKAAEDNLLRLEDVVQQLDAQADSLKRQARQATRYRTLAADIRRAEALILYAAWQEALRGTADAERKSEADLREVAERTRLQAEAAKRQAIAAHAMPGLRDAEAAAAATLQRLVLAREQLDAEERRSRERAVELERRASEFAIDLAREKALIEDAAAAAERLGAEQEALEFELSGSAEAQAEAAERLAALEEVLFDSEAALSAAQSALSDRNARRSAGERALREAEERLARIGRELERVSQERAGVEATLAADAELPRLQAELDGVVDSTREAEEAAEAARLAHAEARDREAALRAPAADADRQAERLETEAKTLAKLLSAGADQRYAAAVDSITVARGFETALGAALGEDLEAALDAEAPVRWAGAAEEPDDPVLPVGARPLTEVVQAPVQLSRRLRQTGIVDRADGDRLRALLRPGQRLVSPEGDLWRWDGYTAAADAPTAAARRLAEKNRLGEIEAQAAEARSAAERIRAEIEEASAAVRQAAVQEAEAFETVQMLRRGLESVRQRLTAIERKRAEVTARLSALFEAEARLGTEREEAETRREQAAAQVEALQDAAELEAALARSREIANRDRQAVNEARVLAQSLDREAEMRARRMRAIAEERQAWDTRRLRSTTQIGEIERRQAEIEAERETLAEAPDLFLARRRELLDTIGTAEEARKAAADRLAEAQTELNAADRDASEALSQLAAAREEKARAEARLEAARARLAEILRVIPERLEVQPGELAGLAGLAPGDEPPPVTELEERLDGLKQDRERLGAVNLRADEELAEVEAQRTALVTERDDLTEAIKRLRTAIQNLNREGRERLLAAFEVVQGHFVRLFTSLFGGGTAQLELVESDDPLEAGLEIVARPPGKKPQTMTLLSGGEQALTAIALIFAVFLTNPSPICVLDEVDAPLDDANVERYCDLLRDMARSTETRFVVITHNPITMARMDRLFGVTMAERGVSQLVSVDLEAAERFLEAS
jgi:chromosome segregation protein